MLRHEFSPVLTVDRYRCYKGFSMAGVILAIVLTFSAAAGGTAYASQSSVPGDTLYPVKLVTEQMRMALPGDDAAKAERALDFAETRIQEIQVLANSERMEHVDLAAGKYDEAMKAVLVRMEQAANEEIITGNLTERVAHATARHLSVLDGVYDVVSDEAKPAIEHARSVSRRGHFRSLKILMQDQALRATEINLAVMEDCLQRALGVARAQNAGELAKALQQFEEMSQFGLDIVYAARQLGKNEEAMVGELVAGATHRHLAILDDLADLAPGEALQAIVRARHQSMNRHREGLLVTCEHDPAGATEINLHAMEGRLERVRTGADNAETVEIALEQFEMMADFGEGISRVAQEVGTDAERVQELMARATLLHVEVLAEVWERVTEQAKEAVEVTMARALIRHESRVRAMGQMGMAMPAHPELAAHLRERVEERIRQQRIWDEREAALSPGIPGFAGGCPGCRR